MSEKQIKQDDLDDIIGIAEQFKLADADQLSFEEVSKVAKELDIPVEYLQKAITEQKRRKALAKQQELRISANTQSMSLLRLLSMTIWGRTNTTGTLEIPVRTRREGSFD